MYPINITLGEVYCGYYYRGHDNGCYQYTVDTCTSLGGGNCELYKDPRMDEFSGAEFNAGSINKGYCISDGKIRYDLETHEELGLIKTDEECSQIKKLKIVLVNWEMVVYGNQLNNIVYLKFLNQIQGLLTIEEMYKFL